jgi:RecA-family ATPase
MPAFAIADYVQLPGPNQVWLWNGILPASGAALLYAKQKIGKSFLALSLAEAVADESLYSYLGQEIQQHGKVLYIQLDTPRGLWIKNYISTVLSAPARENIYIMDREMDDMPIPFDIRTAEAQRWIQAEVERVEPILVIIDTFRRIHRCDENDNTEMSIIYDTLVNICSPAAVLLLMHERKTQQEGQDATVRGASSVAGAVDCLIHMTKKRLKFEARSDIEEELKIFQQDNGTFTVHDSAAEAEALIDELKGKGIKYAEIDRQVAEQFSVSSRTARRWRG